MPLIDKDGAVYFPAVDPGNTDPSSSWIAAMNQSNFAGTNTWFLPKVEQLQQLYQDLGLETDDPRLEWRGFESTDLNTKQFYMMVYYPALSAGP